MARRRYPLLGDLPAYLRDRVAVVEEAAAGPGEVGELAIPRRTLVLKRPEDVGHVLLINRLGYEKTPRLTGPRGRRVVGDGIFTRDNRSATPHRRSLQPLFARGLLGGLEDAIVARVDAMTDAWRPGASVDLRPHVQRLAVLVASDAVVGPDAPPALEAGLALRRRQEFRALHGPVTLPGWFPLALVPARRRALAGFESALAERIAERRARPAGDVVSGLAAGGAGEQLIRDEVLSLSIAGIGAMTNATVTVLTTLARHPDVTAAVREEAASAGEGEGSNGGGDPRARLPYTERVVLESLRLVAPTPMIVRIAQRPDRLPSGAEVRDGDKVIVSPRVLHRDPALYPDPGRFDPDRFADEARRARPRFSYIPFGAGPRACIGRNLAMLELVLIAARVAGRFELAPAGDSAVRVQPAPAYTRVT